MIKKVVLSLLLVFALVTSSATPMLGNATVAEAATIKISKKTLTLEVSKTKTLKINGTTKKVTWSSNKKAVATVSSKGKVTAKAVGEATITAAVVGKKFTCKVTVTEPANPYLKNAPFDATEVQIANIDLVMPSDWTGTFEDTRDDYDLVINLASTDASLSSSLEIDVIVMDEPAPAYSELKKEYTALLTLEYFKQMLTDASGDSNFEITDYKTSDYEASFGNAFKVEYNLKIKNGLVKQTLYCFYLGDYYFEVASMDRDDIDLATMVEYMIDSMMLK